MAETGNPAPQPYHRIRAVEFTGGFLDGSRLEFDDSMNCIIGGRGTGKTTVLELLRYALDRTPDPDQNRYHRELFDNIDKLVKSNLGGGSLAVEIETENGKRYTVKRGVGENPLVTGEGGEPASFDIGKDIVFGVDIYSQNQIEYIANNAYFQLQLIDKFIAKDIGELKRQIRTITKDLEFNATEILDTRKRIADLQESIRELPDISEKIRGFQTEEQDAETEALRREHERKTLRGKEEQLVAAVAQLYKTGTGDLAGVFGKLKEQFDDAFDGDMSGYPNAELLAELRSTANAAIEDVGQHIDTATKRLQAAQSALWEVHSQLGARHALQETKYRELMDKHDQERAKGIERARLEQRQSELLAKQRTLRERQEALERLDKKREELKGQLSELRDKRYQLRLGQAENLNEHLSPMIRIRIEQFGNMDEYRSLLSQAMKGSRIRYGTLVDRAVERIPPSELASLIQSEDREALEGELDIKPDQATRMIIQLKDTPDIFTIETVELHDRPIIELKDGPDYKDSASLSTGQKCTTILPILLVESKRPLLIDQPEDNLDNAFVFNTIVQSIREVKDRRQLIFVTHNPNIPVLGDAGRVFALKSTGRSARVANAGTVDDVANEIMAILEGGKDAFEARRKRYGRPVPGAKGA